MNSSTFNLNHFEPRHSVQLAELLCDPDLLPKVAPLLFDAEVSELCGRPWKHSKTKCQRWGKNPGSIRWKGAKIPVDVPRVRNRETNREVPLETYKRLHNPRPGEEKKLTRSVLLGLSQRKYGQVAEHLAKSFGISGSTAGRVFIEETAKALEAFMNRRFDEKTFVALFIGGKTLRKKQILIAMGLTDTGEKVILGFLEAKSESHECVIALLQDIQERGFRVDGPLLVILDGAKGLHKGVREVFGDLALIQRCQWHKRENVTSKISNKDLAEQVKEDLEAAYAARTYS